VVDPFLQRDEPLVLVGDLNLTEREPAYRDLAVGLWDAQQAIGSGMGHTWRPFPLARFGLPLLRIDYVLGNQKVRPLGLARDCSPRGADHCALIAILTLP
jgi:endonuclease/exonuclease/phosphatase family metal-dependent hydrolase